MTTVGVRDLSGRDGTGQAALVTLESAVRILDRRDIDLTGPGLTNRVYHAAAGLDPNAAGELVERAALAAADTAKALVGTVVREFAPDTIAIPIDEHEPDAEPATILASHSLQHHAETTLYREALVEAAAAHRLTVVRYTALPAEEAHRARLAEWGAVVGRPWRKAHRQAALAALLALG